MSKLKVFGGLIIYGTKQRRVIVATTSQKKAADITKQTLSEIRNWFCVTGNEKEQTMALAEPYTMFVEDGEGNYSKAL